MVDVSKLVKKSLRNVTPYFHGGNVWEDSEKYGIPVDQLIDFSISTSPLGSPEKALEAIHQHLSLIKHYPDPDHEWLLEVLANVVGVNTDNIVVGNGSTELIYLFNETFLDEESEVVIPVPSFSEYKAATERFGGNIVFLKCDSAKNFQLNVEEIEKTLTEKTRVIFLCNPNSPTGCLYEKDALLRVIKMAAEKDVLVFLDEDYIDFVDDGKRFSMAEYVNEYNNLFILRTLTKFYGLAGVRVGFGIGSPDIVEVLKRVKMPWSVNSLAMVATEAAVRDTEFIEQSRLIVSKNRREMMKMLSAVSWLKVYPSETNFILLEIIEGDLTSTQLRDELARKGLLIRNCKDFDGLDDKFFRVTVRKPEENRQLIKAINAVDNKQ